MEAYPALLPSPKLASTPPPPKLEGRNLSRAHPGPSLYTALLPAMKKVVERPRRMRIPAFGEWNYYDDGGYGYGEGDWPVSHYLDSAMRMQAGVVIALPASSPKPLKKVVKWSDSGTLMKVGDEEEQRHRQKVMEGMHGAKKMAKVSDGGAYVSVNGATANYKARRVVKPVDEDLYVIPPDMLCHNNPRKRLTKRLWIGCLGGCSCVPA